MKTSQNAKQAKQEVQPTFPNWVTTAVWLLRKFGELKWLKDIKNFILELVVQASEILVIIALVLSMVNFLTGGALMKEISWLSDAWAWLQAVAIDAGFGVVLVSFLDNFKKETRVQCFVYFILTVLLGFNAGAVTYIDSLSSASHLAMNDPGVNPFPLWVLSLTRAVAVVGFLGVSRIHSYDFTKISVGPLLSMVRQEATNSVVSAPTTVEDVTKAKNELTELYRTKLSELTTPDIKALPEPEVTKEVTNIVDSNQEEDHEVTTIVTSEFPSKKKQETVRKIVQIVPNDEVDTKIREAIRRLEERNEKVSDGSVAKEAGFKSRQTVLRWRQRQEADKNEQVS